jgi:hypothetical protein
LLKDFKVFVVLSVIVVAAFAVAVLQPFGISPDYENYELFLDMARDDFKLGVDSRFEPGFVFLTGLISQFMQENILIYGAFVVVSLGVKLFALEKFVVEDRRARYYLYLAIGFYLLHFFPLHELTQLRAALAVAAIFVAVIYIWGAANLKGMAFVVAAALMHYSSLIMAPFLYLPRMSRRTAVISAVAVGTLLAAASNVMVSVAQIYFAVFQTYEFGVVEEMPNPFSPVFFPEFYLILVSLFYWDGLTEIQKRILTLQMFGFALFYGLIDFTVIAVRGRELFSVLWTIFLVQCSGGPVVFRYWVHGFFMMSAVLSFYLYFVLDFFH